MMTRSKKCFSLKVAIKSFWFLDISHSYIKTKAVWPFLQEKKRMKQLKHEGKKSEDAVDQDSKENEKSS